MCVLWLLLQLIVLLMYWDLRGRSEKTEDKKQEEEEERLLVQPDHPPETYGTLQNSPVMDQSVTNSNSTPPSPPFDQIHSSPLKHFSAARGVCVCLSVSLPLCFCSFACVCLRVLTSHYLMAR